MNYFRNYINIQFDILEFYRYNKRRYSVVALYGGTFRNRGGLIT